MTDDITTQHKTILGAAGAVIVGLITLVWGINNNRINQMEVWRKDVDAHYAELLVTKQQVQTISKQLDDVQMEVIKLRDEIARLRNAPTYK